MKDRRTKNELLEALSLAENGRSDLQAALKSANGRIEDAIRSADSLLSRARAAEKRENQLLAEKSAVYGEDWAQRRTKEYEYANMLRAAERKVGVLRGALVALHGKAKADEIEAVDF